jgi:hypothetical protein
MSFVYFIASLCSNGDVMIVLHFRIPIAAVEKAVLRHYVFMHQNISIAAVGQAVPRHYVIMQ